MLLLVKILQLKVEFVFKNPNFFLTFLSHLDSLIEFGKCTVLQIWGSQLCVLVCDTEWIDQYDVIIEKICIFIVLYCIITTKP